MIQLHGLEGGDIVKSLQDKHSNYGIYLAIIIGLVVCIIYYLKKEDK